MTNMDITHLRKRLSHLLCSSTCSSITPSVHEPIFLSSTRSHPTTTPHSFPFPRAPLTCATASPVSPTTHHDHTHNLKAKAKLISNSYGFTSPSPTSVHSPPSSKRTTWSMDTESTALFSSRSFSSDSSEFYYTSSRRKHASCRYRRPGRRRDRFSSASSRGFRPVVSMEVEKGVMDGCGFAVVKESKNPYGDFRSSMLEMIMERQIFGAEELEALLCSYVSLNSEKHHAVIFKVFADICEVLFDC